MVLRPSYALPRWVRALALGVMLLAPAAARALTVNVVGPDEQPVTHFRWLAQEDATYNSVPGVRDPRTLAVRFHASAMPVAATGHAAGQAALQISLDNSKRYFLSVLPDAGYTLGGAPVAAGQGQVTVVVNRLPLAPAQMTVFVFEDNCPLNGRADLPQERGLAGFRIQLADAAGRQMMDAFGNPLGTAYDAAGAVAAAGPGYALSDAGGRAVIRNLPPGQYTVSVTPPLGEGWQQTTTNSGTPGNQVAVGPGELPREVAQAQAAFGFVKGFADGTVLAGGRTIRGQVVSRHGARPPDATAYPGEPMAGAWVGLNEIGGGRGLYAAPCDPVTGSFVISGVPAGDYQLAIWDEALDFRFTLKNITVAAVQDLDLGKVPVLSHFGKIRSRVFLDQNGNGFPDAGEPGLAGESVKLRRRDGSLAQATVTDGQGECVFSEVFPFDHWLVAEAGGGRFQAAGATVVVDGGGAVQADGGWDWPSRGVLAPQPQCDRQGKPVINPNTGNNFSRTDRYAQTAGSITSTITSYDTEHEEFNTNKAFPSEAFQLFAGQSAEIDWGKTGGGTAAGTNGGISGMVYYATTRAEDDPRFAAAEPWEPGVARVQMNLYLDGNGDGVIDDANGDGTVTLADVDNYPFTWRNAPYTKGPEDIDRNGNGRFDDGDAISVTATDSWDDAPPSGAQGPAFAHQGAVVDALDGLRNFNQVRPGVFDGRYAFTGITGAGGSGQETSGTRKKIDYEHDYDERLRARINPSFALPEGTYIIEACPPPGYQIVREEDKNVDFGDTYQPLEKAAARGGAARLVGEPHLVPAELSLFPGVACKFAGQTRPLADRKQVTVGGGQNAECNFQIFTEVPLAGQIVGRVRDPLASAYNPRAPGFGAEAAPGWLPVAIRDFTGREIARVHADPYGAFNALVPSTYSNNAPSPSGVAGGVWTVVVNSPGPILDTRAGSPTKGQWITDPYYDRHYGERAFSVQALPGTTAYLDAEITRIAAYAGSEQNPPDAELPDGTPVIGAVSGPAGGPVVAGAGARLTITAAGAKEVPNPLYDGVSAQPRTIMRDYGFGAAPGQVALGGVVLTNVVWTSGTISATVPAGAQTGELIVTRASGKASPVGVTVTVGPAGGTVRAVQPSSISGAHPIQDAIDAAQAGDLILVAPGIYNENVILWKPVRLQGWGAGATVLSAAPAPARLQAWRDKVKSLVAGGKIDLLPGQAMGLDSGEAPPLASAEGAGILVLGRNAGTARGGFGPGAQARIDGLTVTGAAGGGIVVNGYARCLEIANCIIAGNQGASGGGIRSGDPGATVATSDGLDYDRCGNDQLWIHHNLVRENGGLGGAGGGIALYSGSDDYRIEGNWVIGNFTAGSGGGIGHLGLSGGGRIAGNLVAFNQSFGAGDEARGGGMFIGGAAPLESGGLTPGAGAVKVTGNLILGNQAGSGDGGGIALARTNGRDVAASPDNPDAWWRVDLVNNVMTNNQAGLAGGAIALADAARVNIIHNTLARNESTGTAGAAFAPGNPNCAAAQPGGVAARAHSAALAAAFGAQGRVESYKRFANPRLVNDIVWQNRSFYYQVNAGNATQPAGLMPAVGAPVYWDLAVLGAAGVAGAKLSPIACLLTDRNGYDGSNVTGEPNFVASYFNGNRLQALAQPETPSAMGAMAGFGVGGNNINVRFGPLTLVRVENSITSTITNYDYEHERNNGTKSAQGPVTGRPYSDPHLVAPSAALGKGSPSILGLLPEIALDADGQPRPNAALEIGADEYYAPGAASPAPLARGEFFTFKAGTLGTVPAPGVLANDVNANGSALRAIKLSNPLHGVLVLRGDGSFDYSPAAGFTGLDSFAYQAGAGRAVSNTGVAYLRVTATGNTPPNAGPDAYATDANQALTVLAGAGVMTNDTDPDRDCFFEQLVRAPAHGTLAFQPSGAFVYLPARGFSGQDAFLYRPVDTAAGRVTTVTITVGRPAAVNHPPEPRAATLATLMDRAGHTRVLPGDPDPGDTFTYALTFGAAHGTATLAPTGIVTYTPAAGYTGADSVTVRVTDQAGAAGRVIIPILVTRRITMPGGVATQFLPDTDGIDTDGDGIANDDNVMIHLGGGDGFVKMADGKVTYAFGFSDLTGVASDQVMMDGTLKAECPGPMIRVREGQRVFLNLTNLGMTMRPDLAGVHSFHWLGTPNGAPIFSGMSGAAPAIKMGGTFAAWFQAGAPGTYLYHCGAEMPEHAQMGMAGSLIVTPRQDGRRIEFPAGSGRLYVRFAYDDGDGSTGYDLDAALQLSAFDPEFHDGELRGQPPAAARMRGRYPLINGRGYPDTAVAGPLPALAESLGRPSQKLSARVEARAGQRVLLRISNMNTARFYTLASTGLAMQVVGVNAKLLRGAGGQNLYYKTMALTSGGGETYDVILDTDGVAPGTYFLYAANLNCLSNDQEDFGGMMTEVVVR